MMDVDYVAQLASAVQAASVLGPDRLAWLGVPAGTGRPHGALTGDPRPALVALLRQRLYASFLGTGCVVPAHVPGAPELVAGFDDIVAELVRANSGAGCWQPGWVVLDSRRTGLTIQRGSLVIACDTSDVLASGRGAPARGQPVALHVPAGTTSRLPGWYLATSDEPFDDSASPIVRLYWHVTVRGAPQLMRLATGQLNQAGIPFELKLASDAGRYAAADAAVLYLAGSDVSAAWDVLSGSVREVELLASVPALTRPIAPGIALAEDPGNGESFGMQRSGLLAEGIVRAWEAGERTLDGRMRVVGETFAEAGISFEQPYLNPGSDDVYDLTWQPSRPIRRRASDQAALRNTLLGCARTIGQMLADDAIWDAERCTWVGATGQPDGPLFTTLDASLYDGTAGIALFLAELHTAEPLAAIRTTALGAIHQSLATAERSAAPIQLGLYTGLPGIAWATVRVGDLLAEPALIDAARALIARVSELTDQPHEHDLLSGSAGAIVALLHLSSRLDDRSLMDLALQLGDGLLADAEVDARGWRWRSLADRSALPLTGFSHGTSGIAHALLRLFAATGDARFREAALGALAWERGWFAEEQGNWPDFRDVDPAALRWGTALPYANAWCHGAPGIGLARMHAARIVTDERLLVEARAALATTVEDVARLTSDPAANLCLCHGLAGNALILQQGALAIGDAGLLTQATAAFASLAERDAIASFATTPGLMTGLSGIGLACLRAAGYDTADVLAF